LTALQLSPRGHHLALALTTEGVLWFPALSWATTAYQYFAFFFSPASVYDVPVTVAIQPKVPGAPLVLRHTV
jgi:hypothetical protein